MQARTPDEMNQAGDCQEQEYGQREEVERRIPSRVVGVGLRFLFGHDEALLARTRKCNRETGQFSELRTENSQLTTGFSSPGSFLQKNESKPTMKAIQVKQ